MASDRVDQCIESMCHKGCKLLWDDIAALEQGEQPEETVSLSTAERSLVLDELKSIMAVYTDTCE